MHVYEQANKFLDIWIWNIINVHAQQNVPELRQRVAAVRGSGTGMASTAIASYPDPEGGKTLRWPGTYCTCMHQLPQETWGAANDCTLFRPPPGPTPRVRGNVISVGPVMS